MIGSVLARVFGASRRGKWHAAEEKALGIARRKAKDLNREAGHKVTKGGIRIKQLSK